MVIDGDAGRFTDPDGFARQTRGARTPRPRRPGGRLAGTLARPASAFTKHGQSRRHRAFSTLLLANKPGSREHGLVPSQRGSRNRWQMDGQRKASKAPDAVAPVGKREPVRALAMLSPWTKLNSPPRLGSRSRFHGRAALCADSDDGRRRCRKHASKQETCVFRSAVRSDDRLRDAPLVGAVSPEEQDHARAVAPATARGDLDHLRYGRVGGGEDLGQRDLDASKLTRDSRPRPRATPVRLGNPRRERAANTFGVVPV
jgi:hypothetical protein